jgi:hypothetical protein
MEHTTFLQDLIGLLISVVIPLVLVMVLVIKNPQTTLSLIKAGFKLLVSAGKFIAPFIMPFLAWMSNQDPFSARSSSSDYGSSSDSLSAKQEHDMDSNGLSRSEAIRNPHW